MKKECKNCKHEFEITQEDMNFYKDISPEFNWIKYSIPAPTHCPDCRQQRRLAFRNERKLYKRRCNATEKNMISIYSPDKPYKIYEKNEWWSDKWNPFDYWQDFNFNETFSKQFNELILKIPHPSLNTKNNQNSYYTNFTLHSNNCYMVFWWASSDDCMYWKFMTNTKKSIDILSLYSCELCYECIDLQDSYNCKYSMHSRNCSDSLLIEDCVSCKNCIMCFGLIQKEYCILNKTVWKEKFEKYKKEIWILTYKKVASLREQLNKLKASIPHKHWHIYSCDNCTWDMLLNSKNCKHCFDLKNWEDSKFISSVPNVKNTYDANFCAPEGAQYCYNVCSSAWVQTSISTFLVWHSNNVYYSMECNNSNDLFWCIWLKNKQYCIFNKQYSKDEYEKLVPTIIKHMTKTWEWWEYFPMTLSHFAYNETIAQEYFPLTKEEVLSKGWKWKDEDEIPLKVSKIIPAKKLPDNISEIPDDILAWAIQCENTQKPFKIIPQELKFYRENNIPIPHLHPDERHKERMKLRNHRKLYDRKCNKCEKHIQTTYSPDRLEMVYCEECYLQTVY